MARTDNTGETIEEITGRISQLTLEIDTTQTVIEIQQTRVERAKEEKRRLTQQRHKIRRISKNLILDRYGVTIKIGDTIEILNKYISFSTWITVQQTENKVKGTKRNIPKEKYCSDKFGVVWKIENSTYAGRHNINKVHFTTDSGKTTWRKSDNVKVNDGERGIYVHSRQRDAVPIEYHTGSKQK